MMRNFAIFLLAAVMPSMGPQSTVSAIKLQDQASDFSSGAMHTTMAGQSWDSAAFA